MALRPLLRHQAVPITALAAAITLYPKNTAYAETQDAPHARKPIYDDVSFTPDPTPTANPDPATSPRPTSSSTPTDRLATQIKRTRLFLHGHVENLEHSTNNFLTGALRLESSFANTVASLAPPRGTLERRNLLPGSIYVLVAAMAGSIITRNRNILLRATVPGAIGVGVAYAVLPITMQNVGNLIWSYEERYPVIRDNHLRIKSSVQHFYETGKAHSQMGLAMAEEKVHGVRESVEDWVKQGK
ncbi:hypothetical protein LTR28_003351 [Elasticomyces elasticus]|nr:hypothetical protein LTR28_003351 [Elasticomyces elasticus]